MTMPSTLLDVDRDLAVAIRLRDWSTAVVAAIEQVEAQEQVEAAWLTLSTHPRRAATREDR